MKRSFIYSIAFILLIASATAFFLAGKGRTPLPGAVAQASPREGLFVAAPGRVEPVSEEVRVSSEIGGRLKEIFVEEGDGVKRGQVLAVLENDDYRAQVAMAKARVEQKMAELRRIVNGARQQERREAWQGVKEAEAMVDNARAELERRRSLFEKGIIAREECDRAEREFKVAIARFEAASERHAFVDDDAREEDRARAEADLSLARAQFDEAQVRYEKTYIRSPIDGIVLRKHQRAGESVSDMRDMPIVTLGNVSTLLVRADVDEFDVGRITEGQRAYVTADAYRGEKFEGRVVRVGQVLGKKNVRTDEPAERVDTKILEVLIELDAGQRLQPGLRVDSFISVDDAAVEANGKN
jgi:HlyD family secretion protein